MSINCQIQIIFPKFIIEVGFQCGLFYLETLFLQLKFPNTNVTIKQKPKSPTKFATLACKKNTYSPIHDFSKIKYFMLSWNMSWNIFIDLQIWMTPQNQVLLIFNIHKVIKNDTFHIWDCNIVAPPYCD